MIIMITIIYIHIYTTTTTTNNNNTEEVPPERLKTNKQ